MKTKELLARYIEGYDLLNNELAQIPLEAIHFKPAPDKWNINKIIVHIADCEANGFINAKKIIAESGTKSTVSEQQLWANTLHYDQMELNDALELIKALRKNLHALLKLIDKEVWNNYIINPEFGKITLQQWIMSYVDHIDIHLKQIRRNHQDWEKTGQKELDY
jgi:hypothetical protein